jgi:hypothetical protein
VDIDRVEVRCRAMRNDAGSVRETGAPGHDAFPLPVEKGDSLRGLRSGPGADDQVGDDGVGPDEDVRGRVTASGFIGEDVRRADDVGEGCLERQISL